MEFDPNLPWREIRGEGFNRSIGPIRFAAVDAGNWRAALAVEARHVNIGGVCHGGVLMTLADVAMGAASFAAGGDHPCATLDMDAHFLAAAKEGQMLVAGARQLRQVRGLSFMECQIWAGGRQVLRASGIWKYLDSRGPARVTAAPH